MDIDIDDPSAEEAEAAAGTEAPVDGRKKRSEAFQKRRTALGKKHGRLDESKVCFFLHTHQKKKKKSIILTTPHINSLTTPSVDSATFSA